MGLRKDDSNYPIAAVYRAWLLPILVVCISCALVLGDDSAREWLRFDRTLIGGFQFWRLFSGHFVHLGLSHFALNAAGLLLVWHLVGSHLSLKQWLCVGLGSIIGIDSGFWLFEPQLGWYVGLSGLLHGVLAAGIVAGWKTDRPMTQVLAIMVIAKLAYEQFAGPLPGSEATSGGSVVVAAHLYGTIGGAVTAAILVILQRQPIQTG
jgi:rhomboid family GlyGly-CTERM serine protease